MKKCRKIVQFLLFVFGCGGIISAIADATLDLNTRVFVVFFGLALCVIATIAVIRWAVISILSLLVGLTGVPQVFTSGGNIDTASLLLVISCIGVALYFGRKAFRDFRLMRIRRISRTSLAYIDIMSGLEFEEYTAWLLRKLGYSEVTVTKASGDQGIDVLANKDGTRYAIQCKNYTHKLDNTSVQEAYAGKTFYNCDFGVVITNRTFTQGAQELANSIGVLLWDRSVLQDMISRANRKRHFKCNFAENMSNGERPIPATNATEIDTTIIENLTSNLSAGIEDGLLPSAVDVILETGQASISAIQRRLKIGYARAARIVDEMEEKGIVGPFQGSKPRDILITPPQWEYVKSRFSPFLHHEPESGADDVNPQFIAQAQWCAARGGADLIDDE